MGLWQEVERGRGGGVVVPVVPVAHAAAPPRMQCMCLSRTAGCSGPPQLVTPAGAIGCALCGDDGQYGQGVVGGGVRPTVWVRLRLFIHQQCSTSRRSTCPLSTLAAFYKATTITCNGMAMMFGKDASSLTASLTPTTSAAGGVVQWHVDPQVGSLSQLRFSRDC